MSNDNMNCPCCGKQLQEANAATLRLHFRSSVTCVFADLPAAERAAFIKKYSIAPCACDTLVKITKQGKADGRHLSACAAQNGGERILRRWKDADGRKHIGGARVRQFEVAQDGALTGTYFDVAVDAQEPARSPQASRGRSSLPKTAEIARESRETAESESESDDDFLDGSAEQQRVSANTRSRAQAQNKRTAAIIASIHSFSTTLSMIHDHMRANADLAPNAVLPLPSALATAAHDDYAAIGTAASRPLHSNAVTHNESLTRAPHIAHRERALIRFDAENRTGELTKRLQNSGLADVTRPDVQQALAACYPSDDLDARDERIAEAYQNLLPTADSRKIALVTEGLFDMAVARLKSDKAAGPHDNLYSNDVIEILQNAACRTDMLKITNYILQGVPHYVPQLWKRMAAVKLFALLKDDTPTNVRGIAVSSMLLKLPSLCMLIRHSDAMQAATPFNFGNGQPGGTEAFAHAARTFAANQATCTLSADVCKAFDQCDVSKIMNAIAKLGLSNELIQFTNLWYSIPMHALVYDASRNLCLELDIEDGVRQGDVMSMPLYGIGIQPVLAAARTAPGTIICNYADDVQGNAVPRALAASVYALAESLPELLGNQLGADKTFIYAPSDDMRDQMIAALAEQHALVLARPQGYEGPDLRNLAIRRDGFLACGAPIGTDAYVTAELDKIVIAAKTTVEHVLDCLDPRMIGRAKPLRVQAAVEILRTSILPRFNHIARALPPIPAVRRAAGRIDTIIDTTLRVLHGMELPAIISSTSAAAQAERAGGDPATVESAGGANYLAHISREASWQRWYIGRNKGMGFYRIEQTCAAAFLGATALVAPTLHMLFGARSRLTTTDSAITDINSLALTPLHPNYTQLLQTHFVKAIKNMAPKESKAQQDAANLGKELNRAALNRACIDWKNAYGKPLVKKQRAFTRAGRIAITDAALDAIERASSGGAQPSEGPGSLRLVHPIDAINADGTYKREALEVLGTAYYKFDDPEDEARNRSLSSLGVFTLSGRDRRNRMPDREWVFSIRLALGIDILASDEQHKCPFCRKVISATATHAISCYRSKGWRTVSHDIIVAAIATTLADGKPLKDGIISSEFRDVITDKSVQKLSLRSDPEWMHSPCALAALGSNQFAVLAEEDSEADDDDDREGATGSQGTAATGGSAASAKGKQRSRRGRKNKKLRDVDIRADLRYILHTDSPELNPVQARNAMETVDLRITSPLSETLVQVAARILGHAAKQSEAEKEAHYSAYFPEDRAFVAPLVIETFGHIDTKSENTLKRLALLSVGYTNKNVDPEELRKQGQDGSDSAMQFYRAYSLRMKELRSAISKALWTTNARTMDRWLRAANARSPLSLSSPLTWEGPTFPCGLTETFRASLQMYSRGRVAGNSINHPLPDEPHSNDSSNHTAPR